jgi:acyl-CoA synthetase (AMP-forming)/AMP-acid ligase II
MFSSIVASSRATHALTSTSYNHLKKIAGIKEAVARLNRPTGAWPDNLKWIATNDGKNANVTEPSFPLPTSADLAFLQFTSGSTSEPKGVMITHGNLAHNLTIITNELKAGGDTVVVSWLPQYHDMGLIGSYLGVLYCGGCGYYMSPLSFLQRPQIWIEAVSKYKATHLQAPNFAFKLSARKFQTSTTTPRLDLSCVRHVINAAEPVTEDAINAFVKTFGPYGFSESSMFPTYGLAEHTVFVCSGGKQRLTVDKTKLELDRIVVETDSSENSSRLIGCGFPASQGVDARIVNHETGTELAEDHVGEIWIQSASKAAGYFEKPLETKDDFFAMLNGDTEGRYLRSGDIGFLHKQELFICGRLKDLIIVGGRNYYPQDLEATAEEAIPALRPGCSAAFTVDPTAKGGEEIAMVLELREVPKDIKGTCEPLVETIRAVILQEHSLRLADVVLLKPKSVPKTTSGKIARAWCRKGYLANTLNVVYRKDYKTNETSMEMEDHAEAMNEDQVNKLRCMDKKELLMKLKCDLAKIASSSPEVIPSDVAIATLLDSLSVSQFKGQLEARYAVSRLSDEYLFRETCTLNKLVEVVRLGCAPDDGDGQGVAATSVAQQGPGGLAGALGCPPGVICTIL